MSKEIPQEYIDKGEEGVVYVQQLCEQKMFSFRRGTKEEDLYYGVDCYINDNPTDVKNTEDIYVCQIFTESGQINTRHPFKASSKTTHYYVVDTKKNKDIEFVEVKQRLLRDFIKDEKALKQFYSLLQEMDKKGFKNYGLHLSHACIQIKEKLLACCKSGVKINYPEPSTSTEIYFKLSKKNNSANTIIKNQAAVSSILDKLKNGFNNQQAEEVIQVDI